MTQCSSVERLMHTGKTNGMHYDLFPIQMGLQLVKRFPSAHMSAAWSHSSQIIWGRFTRPDGAETVLLMHHFPHTALNQLKDNFLDNLIKSDFFP